MKIKNYFILTIFVSFTCLILSCGDTGARIIEAFKPAVEVITPEQEYYIGRAVAANILSRYDIYNKGNLTEDELTLYLNKICAAITINSDRPDVYNGYHVAILDADEVNAFATPGGHIFVTRGLISAAKTEDALAGVIAHEVAHIQLQHSIKAIQTDRLTKALIITATTAIGAATGMDFNELTSVFTDTVGDIVNTVVNSGYSRQQEFEADTKALSLLADAGYYPSGLISMLTELKNVQGNSNVGFGKTHPTPEERIGNAQASIGNYSVPDNSSERQERFNSIVRW